MQGRSVCDYNSFSSSSLLGSETQDSFPGTIKQQQQQKSQTHSDTVFSSASNLQQPLQINTSPSPGLNFTNSHSQGLNSSWSTTSTPNSCVGEQISGVVSFASLLDRQILDMQQNYQHQQLHMQHTPTSSGIHQNISSKQTLNNHQNNTNNLNPSSEHMPDKHQFSRFKSFSPEITAQVINDRLHLQATLAQNVSMVNSSNNIKRSHHLFPANLDQNSPRFDKWPPTNVAVSSGNNISLPNTLLSTGSTSSATVEQLPPTGFTELQAVLLEQERVMLEQSTQKHIFPEEVLLHLHPRPPHLDPHINMCQTLAKQTPFLHLFPHALPPGFSTPATLLNHSSALPHETFDYYPVIDAFSHISPALFPSEVLYDINPYQLLGLHPFLTGFRPFR